MLPAGTYIEIDGVKQPAPAPLFSRTQCETPAAPHAEGADTADVLTESGYSAEEIEALKAAGTLT